MPDMITAGPSETLDPASPAIMRRFIRRIVSLGIGGTLRRRGFERPGGGWRFFRERGQVRQSVTVLGSWMGPTGELWFSIGQSIDGHSVSSLDDTRTFPLDLVVGDPDDGRGGRRFALVHRRGAAAPGSRARPHGGSAEVRGKACKLAVGLEAAVELWNLLGRAEEARRVGELLASAIADGPPF